MCRAVGGLSETRLWPALSRYAAQGPWLLVLYLPGPSTELWGPMWAQRALGEGTAAEVQATRTSGHSALGSNPGSAID